ncbi:hypothetical protein AB6A40_008922 [Gnathostoma spinigerum]|uniref:UBX domain-containing protein n=1 Tax=Gnathostoma spinigerum TaxID=75299 RepID=A0ABD6EYQ7_9BILA
MKRRRKGEDMPEIDELVNGGSKLTFVDRDEWKKFVGSPDGKGTSVSIMVRFPDGTRSGIDVEDTTPLKAIFLFIAGHGYTPSDYLLVFSYPKREIGIDEEAKTLRELSLTSRELIHVEKK